MSPAALRRRLYLFSFVDEFGPLYALYAVWFAACGLSAAQISWVFLAWAGIGLVAEVPSGALADRVNRRWLIAAAIVVRAVGIGTWFVWPTFSGILLGAGLWAVHGALASGTWEALVYDLVAEDGEPDDYARVMARVGQANHAGITLGALIATAATAAGATIPVLGWVTVAVHVLAVGTVLSLPDAPASDDDAPLTVAGWLQTLRDGVRAAGGAPIRTRLLGVGVLLEGLFILDEYQPLLAHARGASDTVVPLLVGAVWAGLILGGELAARRPRLRGPVVGGLLIGSALLVLLAVWSGSIWALALLGVGYAAQNLAWIITDARFQQRVPDAVRATTTSVRAFFGGVISMGAFALVAALSDGADPGPGLPPLLAVLILAGGLLVVWLPDAAEAP